VVLYQGEFVALTKKKLKRMRKSKLLANLSLKQIEANAVYITGKGLQPINK